MIKIFRESLGNILKIAVKYHPFQTQKWSLISVTTIELKWQKLITTTICFIDSPWPDLDKKIWGKISCLGHSEIVIADRKTQTREASTASTAFWCFVRLKSFRISRVQSVATVFLWLWDVRALAWLVLQKLLFVLDLNPLLLDRTTWFGLRPAHQFIAHHVPEFIKP